MFEYHITSGSLYDKDKNWLGTGYSGAGLTYAEGRNNPDKIKEVGVGPIPPGIYHIGPAYRHPQEGPCVMNLTPEEGTNTFGRSAFHIHGNNKSNNASHGCIILGPDLRDRISKSLDKQIKVTIT